MAPESAKLTLVLGLVFAGKRAIIFLATIATLGPQLGIAGAKI